MSQTSVFHHGTSIQVLMRVVVIVRRKDEENIMRIKYIHTGIIVEDLQKSINFYQAVLGCMFVPPQKNITGRWLGQATGVETSALNVVHLRLPGYGNNGPTLEICSYNKMLEKPHAQANRKGFGHIAFCTDNVEDVLEKIINHGGGALGQVTVKKIIDIGILTLVYAYDPENNIIEIQKWS